MKKDLSSMLVQGGRFNTVEELKDYLVEYVLELILIELENLPEDQWDKTLKTWEKIVLLSYGIMNKPLEEREKLYERWKFDAVMKTIMENLAEALRESLRLGLLKEKQEPEKLLQIALQHALNKGYPQKEMLLEVRKLMGLD
jgi:CHASE3 domain sensor protein